MRLYLSSFRLGNQPQNLVGLVGANKRAAIINNAIDLLPETERSTKAVAEQQALQALGFSVQEIDLRQYFGRPQKASELQDSLADYGMLWVRGGNTFVLRRAMRLSGFDRILLEALKQDAIVYAGYSAGVCVLVPSLRGLEFVDDPDSLPAGYESEVIWDGLSILPYAIAPHYRSDHFESAVVEEVVQHYIDHRIPFRALRDGEAIVLNGEREELVS